MNATRGRGWTGGLAALWGGAGGAGSLLPIGLLLLAAALGGWIAWQRWGAGVLQQPSYLLTPDNILVTPQPAWIHTDVKSEVVRTGSLEKLKILDPNAALQIQQAFALHPWVSDVRRVRKRYPAQVEVDLVYRRPVAMVKAVSGGYWPVAADAVLLPPEEFSPEQTRHFLRVIVEHSQPEGPAGTPYGDERVAGAARIADLLQAHRERLQLEHVLVVAQRTETGTLAEPTYELYTAGGTRILWGRSPGREGPGEVTASEKVARLLAYVEQRGPLDSATGAAELDLRDAAGIGLVPRTAAGQWPRPAR